MAKKALPCPTLVRLLLDYDQTSGHMTWRSRAPWLFKGASNIDAEGVCRRWNTRFAGKRAFTTFSCGGFHGSFLSKCYRAHRLAWVVLHGRWPDGEIDHINGDPSDNRADNLRDVSHRQNTWNIGPHSGASSQYAGVSRHGKKWRARILSVDGREIHLGTFDTEIDAALIRDREIRKLKGMYPRMNFPGRIA